MKVRTDFVTNSSSSSFILARKEDLTEQQKELIIKYVEEELLGTLQLSPESTADEINEFLNGWYLDEDDEAKIREQLKAGNSIYAGAVCFEESEWNLADIYRTLWEKLQTIEESDFVAIDDDLDY